MSETGILRLKRRHEPTITKDFFLFFTSIKKGDEAEVLIIVIPFSPKKEGFIEFFESIKNGNASK